MISVDGRRFHVQTGGLEHAGGGRPTVIFESGGGSPFGIWTRVFGQIARFAPVLAYDRPGNVNGLSERDGQLPTPRHIAGRLHALLAELGLKPPYVLVGHSWGGPLIRMFAALYPDEVAGLVYVDPTDLRTGESGLAYLRAQGYSAEALALQRRDREQKAAAAPTAKAPQDTEDRALQALMDSDYAEFRTLPPIPDVPVSVLMSAKFDPTLWKGRPCEPTVCHEVYMRFRVEWLKDFTQAVTDSTLTIATGSGHRMHYEDPELVVAAVQRVVNSAARVAARIR
jgi:pimeloyl-ACP methyl ester carboxylesterase